MEKMDLAFTGPTRFQPAEPAPKKAGRLVWLIVGSVLVHIAVLATLSFPPPVKPPVKSSPVKAVLYTPVVPAPTQPGAPLTAQIPNDDTNEGRNALVNTMGVDMRVDENGNYWLISYAHAAPAIANNAKARQIAAQSAHARALGGLRTFMAEEVSGENPCKGFLRIALVHKKEIVKEAMERISDYFRKNT